MSGTKGLTFGFMPEKIKTLNSHYKGVVNLVRILSRKNLIKFVDDRLGHDFRYAVDFSKLKKDLNWQPKISFEDGLEMTISWYMKNEKWWRKLIKKS